MQKYKDYSHLFTIDEQYTALNHGSFGACTKAVTEYRFSLIRRMESLTTRFFMMEMKPLLQESLKSLADFVNAPVEDTVFVSNATTAASAVLKSIQWKPYDEIVTTNLIYESCSHLINLLARTHNLTVHIAEIDFVNDDDDSIIEKIFSLVNDRTKLLFIDHIASTTALILPVEKITAKAKEYGIDIFIDGAHAPGILPLDIIRLKPDYYTGNCHKWLCSPKGAAFLYVKPSRQEMLIPPVISNYFQKGTTVSERMFNSFYWLGTMDYTSCICVAAALRHIENEVEGGWQEVMRRNRSLVIRGRDIICEELKFNEYTPEKMTGSMVSIKTGTKSNPDPATTLDYLYYEILNKFRIETIFAPLQPAKERLLRLSAHIYNKESDYVKLAQALKQVMTAAK